MASRPEPTRIAQDVNLSVDLTATFRLTARRKCASTIDMSVNVLTASNWPTMTPTDVSLPPEIVELQTLFTEYYCSKHANRKLIWEPFLGHCLVHGNFEKGSKDLTMSIYQVRALTVAFSHDRGREKGCMRDHQVGSVAVTFSIEGAQENAGSKPCFAHVDIVDCRDSSFWRSTQPTRTPALISSGCSGSSPPISGGCCSLWPAARSGCSQRRQRVARSPPLTCEWDPCDGYEDGGFGD